MSRKAYSEEERGLIRSRLMDVAVLTTRMTEGRRMLLTFAETADETSSLQIKSLVALVLENRVI